MPKVFLNDADRVNDRIVTWAYGSMKAKRISQRKVADELGITQQALSYRLKNRLISVSDFACFIKLFHTEKDEVIQLLK